MQSSFQSLLFRQCRGPPNVIMLTTQKFMQPRLLVIVRMCTTNATNNTNDTNTSTSGAATPPLRQQRANQLIDRIIRVDHAGEYGAQRIYEGQLAVLGRTSVGPIIQEMYEQEMHHLRTFEKLMPEHRARPTALLPLWHAAGFALGAGSALLGKEAAMACTVAVETVIGEHYDSQLRHLFEDDPEKHGALMATIKQFRDDEMEHHDIGLDHDAEKAPFYRGLTEVIKYGCRAAIWITKRV